MGHNEMLIGEALKGVPRDSYKLSGQVRRAARSRQRLERQRRAAGAVKNFLAYTLQRLGVDYIDIYRPARLDPDVPIEDTVGAIAECIEAGWVRHVGLSEVGPETLAPGERGASDQRPADRIRADHPQHRARRSARVPRTRHRAHRLRRVRPRACSPAAGGRASNAPSDFRHHAPRFQGEAGARNARRRRRDRPHRARFRNDRRASPARLGPGAGRRHRSARRRAQAEPGRGGGRGARARPHARTSLPQLEARHPADAIAGRALCAGADGASWIPSAAKQRAFSRSSLR